MVLLDPQHEPDAVYNSLEEFLAKDDRHQKVVRIQDGPMPLDFRYIDRGSENLTAFFTAAVPKDSLAPRFTGFGISTTLPTNGLHFADPSVALTPEIFLAWYTGSAQQPMRGVIPQIIRHYQPENSSGRTVMYGGSGGGFAGLVNGFELPDSICVAANPQTDLRKYNPPVVRRWLEACWPTNNQKPADIDQIDPVTDLVSLYSGGSPNKVIYLQNTQDGTHMSPHFEPFIRATQGHPGVRYFVGDWGEGHNPPPKDLIVQTLQFALTHSWEAPDWGEAGYRLAREYTTSPSHK